MATKLVITEIDLLTVMRRLIASPLATVQGRLSDSGSRDDRRLCVAAMVPPTPVAFADRLQFVIFGYVPEPTENAMATRARELLFVPPTSEIRPRVAFVIGGLRRESRLRGYWFTEDGTIQPIPAIHVIGPGMPVVTADTKYHSELTLNTMLRLSRTLPVVGSHTIDRLQQGRILINGCGRSGSLSALNLARLGIPLTLIDPDVVDHHNLDGELIPSDVGRSKVTALADEVARRWPGLSVEPLQASITSLDALFLLRNCDAGVSAVDDDGARFVAANLTALYLLPLVDIGVGIGLTDNQPGEFAGLDVRLTIPGNRCLLCLGGFANPHHIDIIRESHSAEVAHRANRNFQAERLGSMRSLNQIAVGMATQCLLDYFSGRLTHSIWVRITINQQGIPSLAHLSPPARENCPLCALRGTGDTGLRQMSTLPTSWEH